MMEQRTEGYRDVLEALAKSRGLSGAEDLAERVVEADPDYTVRGVLEGDAGGFGDALDTILDPPSTEEERERLVRALVNEPKAKRARGLCPVPGCERPGLDNTFGCKEHLRAYDAQAEEDAWSLAISILRPWVDSARPIGSDELLEVMEAAEASAVRKLEEARAERAEAEAALESA